MVKRNRKVRQPPNINIKNSGYSEGGASQTNKSLKSWTPRRLSANADIVANLTRLRDRSSDQAINTPLGAAAIGTSATHTIGTGLRLFPKPKHRILGITAKEARDWARKTREEFDLWATSTECDQYRRNSLYDLQSIAYTGYLTDGDIFAVFRRKPGGKLNPYSLKVQIVEGNRISNPQTTTEYTYDPYGVTMTNYSNGNRIVNGVEIDKFGAVEAYWISNRVPLDPTSADIRAEWVRIKAYGSASGMPNILQICHDVRAEQYRGVPYLAPVIETLKQVSRYTTAELTSAIIKSFFSLFFTETTASNNPLDILNPKYDAEDMHDPVVDVSEYSLGPGTLNALPKGVDVKSIDAANAQSTFDPFVTQMIKQIGAAINQPYEVLMKHFESSYSASRAALLQAWEEFKIRRTWFSRDFCQPIYETWLVEAIALGRIEAPGFHDDPLIRKAWCNAEWYGPTMSILDPVKDVNGSALRTTYGLSTREREAAEMTGTDFEENLEQLAVEQEIINNLELNIGDPKVLAGQIELLSGKEVDENE